MFPKPFSTYLRSSNGITSPPTSADYPELGATSAREAVDQEVLSARVV
jgi:hypothetical protein